MGIFDDEKKHIFENDILYRGYNTPNGNKVCFKFFFENSLNAEEIALVKKIQGKEYSGKACFWFSDTSKEIFCKILNKDYTAIKVFNCNDKAYSEIVNKIWISMWEYYYNSIDFNSYYEIVDILFAPYDDNTTIEERLFSYVSISDNYNYFNYQIEKMFWSRNENIRFKDFFYSQQSKNENLMETYNKYKENGNQIRFNTIYRLTSFKDFFAYLINELISNEVTIKKCANCEKYFSPKIRTDTIYCDSISPQDNRKTCKEYGAIKTYQENLKNDEAKGLYRKIYMKKQMRTKRYPDILTYKEDFENFKSTVEEWKNKIKNDKSLQSDYIDWLRKENDKN